MTSITEIEKAVQSLSDAELAEFRAWFASFDHERFDQAIARDITSGKLDGLADEALADHDAGRTRPR